MVPLLRGARPAGRSVSCLPSSALVLYSLLPILRNTVAGLARHRSRGPRGGGRRRHDANAAPAPRRAAAGAAGDRGGHPHRDRVDRRDGDALDAGRGRRASATTSSAACRRGTRRRLSAARRRRLLALGLDGSLASVGLATGARRRRAARRSASPASRARRARRRDALARRAAPGPRPVRIGAKTFTEQYVLAEILARQIARARRGAPSAWSLTSLGSTVAFDALARGEIDVYVEYTGTIWAQSCIGLLRRPARARARGGTRVAAETHGIRLVGALGFENAYCFAVRRETADGLRLRTLGDLSRHAALLTLASDYEFFSPRGVACGRARLRARVPREADDGSVAPLPGDRRAPGGRGDGLLVGRPHRRARPRDARGREGRDPALRRGRAGGRAHRPRVAPR